MNSVYAPVLLVASLVVYIVLLALLSTLVARVNSHGHSQSRRQQQQLQQRPRDASGVAGAAILGTGAPTILQQPAVANVIPLYWDAGVSEYIIRFTAGASTVTAAFDTGSAKLVLATAAGQSASGTYYDTVHGSPVSMSGVVGTGSSAAAGAPQQCTFTQAYGTQTDTVAVFEDTVAFPRVQLQLCTLCTASTTSAVAGAGATTPLSIPNFPVNGIVNGGTTVGTPSVNVFGMSSVITSTRAGTAYLLPSCQQVPEPQYEAALLQTLAAYYAAQPGKPDFCWSMMLGTPPAAASTALRPQPAGFVVFGPLSVPCLRPQFTPAVAALPSATTPLTATPGRYYVVQVLSASIGPAGAAAATAFVPLTGFPQFLLVDSGTTQVLLSSSAGAAQNATNINALNSIGADQVARITLVNNVVIEYTKPMVTWEAASGGPAPVFAAMKPAFAAELSSTSNVGILGSTGMRDLYVEFNLSRAQIGFAQVCTTCGSCT